MADRDFTGFDFAVGSVFGNRAWNVDAGGNLRGVTFKNQAWSPGVNEAACLEMQCDCFSCQRLMATIAPSVDRERGEPGDGSHLAKHRCGFYAYYMGFENDYEPPPWAPRALGVVEGFGETVLGSKGFRAQKARIVALHLPAPTRLSTSLIGKMLLAGLEDYDGFTYAPRYERAREKYADIPFYDDPADMYREHPASEPLPPVKQEQDPHYPTEWASGE